MECFGPMFFSGFIARILVIDTKDGFYLRYVKNSGPVLKGMSIERLQYRLGQFMAQKLMTVCHYLMTLFG